jgi:RNA polymerase primary sigma factor
VESNLLLVVKISRCYKRGGIALMDLIQEGNIGLMRAAEKYDADKNTRFSTYAYLWIRQAINRSLANKRRAIRLPVRKEFILKKIQYNSNILAQRLGRAPHAEEIAREIDVPVEEIRLVLDMSGRMLSLEDESVFEDVSSIVDTQEDFTYCPVRSLLQNSSRAETIRFLGRLKERERRVIMYRYQFIPNAPWQLQKIANLMGMSPEAVRQIELHALRKLRKDAAAFRECVYA